MSDTTLPRMTAAEFLDWAMRQPETEHYELVNGEVFAMAPVRVAHARAKFHLTRRLAEAVEKHGLPCEVFAGGVAVHVDEATIYEPDAMLRCGERLPGSTVAITDPTIVVEVVSRGSRGRDTGIKLTDYLRLPSVRHYVIADAEARSIIHHARQEDGTILTRISRGEPLRFDPPGLTVDDPLGFEG